MISSDHIDGGQVGGIDNVYGLRSQGLHDAADQRGEIAKYIQIWYDVVKGLYCIASQDVKCLQLAMSYSDPSSAEGAGIQVGVIWTSTHGYFNSKSRLHYVSTMSENA